MRTPGRRPLARELQAQRQRRQEHSRPWQQKWQPGAGCPRGEQPALSFVPALSVKGHCLVAATGTACVNDTDCQRVDNCCDFLALPKTAMPPACAIKSCFVNTCTGWGLSSAKAMCISGVCRMRQP